MRYDRQLRALLGLCIGLGWAVSAWAASSDLADLAGLPWARVGLGMVLALWGGLTFTAQRLTKALQAGGPVTLVLPGVLADLAASLGAGFVTTAFGAWQQWGAWPLAVGLYVAGYAGTRLLEPMASALVERVAAIFDRLMPPKT